MLAKEMVVCPGVYDGFTARLALNAGFKALYMVIRFHVVFLQDQKLTLNFKTGAGTTMSRLGIADLGVATMNDMRDHAAMIASIDPTVPLIADADTGYGGQYFFSLSFTGLISQHIPGPLMVGRTTAA